MSSITQLERRIIVTARKYLVGDNQEDVRYNLPLTTQDTLKAESNPWSGYWLYSKIENEYRTIDKNPPSYEDFQKALMSLIKKKYLKLVWSDRFILIVEATRLVK